jgi:dihydrofolate synthase/folylpolyglutamate synthase
MNYPQTLDYLLSRLPMFSRIGSAAYKKDLTNTIRLCEFLDNPYEKFKSIHVAGTNGKGSVSHMLAAILQTAGYKTGLYTSPHLKDFRERIRVNGKEIGKQFVIDFTQQIKPLSEEIEPSFFEITVAMAFAWFADEKVDVAVIEVGLGGRLDSTNIITPELSVITNIGMDHMNMLGDTLEKIAVEKAGIIKQGVPVVIGESLPETRPVFENIAAGKGAPLFFASSKRKPVDWHWENHQLVTSIEELHKTDHRVFQLDLPGIYQVKNLVTVLEACTVLNEKGWNLEDKTIQKALRHVKKTTGLHGRWEVIHISPLVVLDVAHNYDGILQLVRQVEITDHSELHIVIGLVRDKDIDKIFELLPRTATYYFTKAQIPRAFPEHELQQKGNHAGLRGISFPEVNAALKAALQNADAKDLVVVCGSVFVVGEVNIPIH